MVESKEPLVIDLREVKYQLEDSGLHESELTERCGCGVSVSQFDATCPGCNRPIIWTYSKAWKRMFGSPEDALREYQDLAPETNLEREVIRWFGHKGMFSSKTQRDQVRGIIRMQGEEWVRESLNWKRQAKRSIPFRSWLTHARNNKPASFGRRGREPEEHVEVETQEATW